MENFIYDIGTKIYFGKDQIKNIGDIVQSYGKKALLIYGGGSIKTNGIYDAALTYLKQKNITVEELSGVEPNPRIETVRKGVTLCKENQIEVIVPIGGGSVIDCAKVIAAGAFYEGDAWDLVLDPKKITHALPIISVLTLSATGSEMDTFAVISDMKQKEKIGTGHPLLRPKASILDPTYTQSVSKYQTAAGTADIMSHIMETYFSNKKGFMQDRIAEALLKTCITYGKKAYENPDDYEARSNLMWASSWAINDFIKLGKEEAWTVHPMEHELSAYYDITHGVGLAILTPHYFEFILDNTTVDKFCEFAHNVWEIPYEEDKYQMAQKGIDALKEFFEKLHIPKTLKEVGISEEYFDEMAQKASSRLKGAYRELTKEEVKQIYQRAL